MSSTTSAQTSSGMTGDQQTLLIVFIVLEGIMLITCGAICIKRYVKSRGPSTRAASTTSLDISASASSVNSRRSSAYGNDPRRSNQQPSRTNKGKPSKEYELDEMKRSESQQNLSGSFETHENISKSSAVAAQQITVPMPLPADPLAHMPVPTTILSKPKTPLTIMNGNNSTASSTSKSRASKRSRTKINNTAATNTTFTTTTMVGSEVELSIPAYLEVTYGQDFSVVKHLTHGGAASVYLGKTNHIRLRKYGNIVVIKQLQPHSGMPENLLRDAFHQELAIMWYFRESENFIKVLGFTETPMSFISKFYPDGALDRYVRKKKFPITRKIVFKFLLGISDAILCMHAAGFIHCDLKSSNILIDRNSRNEVLPVLSDFGIAQILESGKMLVKDFPVIYNNAFSYNYAAPDVFFRLKDRASVVDVPAEVSRAQDLYSFGCIMYFLLVQYEPWTVVN